MLLLDSQEQYDDFKKCYLHNSTWSGAGCSIDTGTSPLSMTPSSTSADSTTLTPQAW